MPSFKDGLASLQRRWRRRHQRVILNFYEPKWVPSAPSNLKNPKVMIGQVNQSISCLLGDFSSASLAGCLAYPLLPEHSSSASFLPETWSSAIFLPAALSSAFFLLGYFSSASFLPAASSSAFFSFRTFLLSLFPPSGLVLGHFPPSSFVLDVFSS